MNLSEMRNKKGLTMAQIASVLNLSESYYSLLENGKRRPSVDVAKKIGAALGFDWTLFYEDEGMRTQKEVS